ncbi:MAG: InlB B-repeat-containing protein [Treponema sp.]|jgi:uncharacterized repeat protein (TIGR02543 family)|nr:InlB B-repeat-containing protein [Treponema sp.]
MERFFAQIARLGKSAAFLAAAALVLALAACPNPSGGDPERHTVTFDSQGGSAVDPITAEEGAEVPKPADPAKADHTFQGWYSAAEGGTLYAWPHTLNADVTMYARWEAAGPPPAQQYTITFNSQNGSTVAPVTADEGTQVPKPADPARENYTFEGWYSAASGGTLYAWPYALERDITMYARWTAAGQPPVQRHTITFDSHGGSAVPPITANEGTQVSKPADPVKNGYAFQGWFDAETGGAAYDWPHALAATVTMHAQWTLAAYSISYNLGGGTNAAENPAEYTIESADIALAAPTRAGYTFGGWFANSGFTGAAVTAIPAGSTGDRTFYARWSPIVYNISYNLGGGTNAPANPATYTIASAGITLAAPSRAGYAFGGWFDNEGFTGTEVTVIPAGSAGDKTFYAKWALVTYTITFDSQGGSPVNPITEAGGAQVSEPAAPTRADHLFEGWRSSAEGGTLYAWPYTLNGNVTMFARWQALLTGSVSITGAHDAQGGTTPLGLIANTGALGGSGTISYQWERADSAAGTFANIDGATDATYDLVAADQGKHIRVTVSRAGYSGTKSSAPAGPVVLPAISGAASITGAHDAGGGNVSLVLTADTASLGGSGTIIYQWERSDAAAATGNWTAISGAAGATYRLVAPDEGKYIRVRATRVGYSGTIPSAAAGPVVLPVLSNSGPLSIIGTPQVRLTLAVDTSVLSGSDTSFTYIWERSDTSGGPWTAISGATEETYTLARADENKYIRVRVSRVGYNGTVDSNETAQVGLQTPGGGNITIGFNYDAIVIDGSDGINEIYKASAGPNNITLSASGYTDVKWYVDGDIFPAGTGDSITLNASDYSVKSHSITFTGRKDGNLYSQIIPFTVKN